MEKNNSSRLGCGCGCLPVIIVVIVLVALFGSSDDDDDIYTDTDQAEYSYETKRTQDGEDTVQEVTTEEEEEIIDYYYTSADTMADELKNNALAASQKYVGKYVAVSGRVGSIDSEGKYMYLDGDFSIYNIYCSTKGDKEVISQMAQLSSGASVTIYGKVTDVGDIIGYHMEIYQID